MARTPYRQRPCYNYKQLEAQQNAPSPSKIYVLYVPTNKILEFCQIGAFKNRVFPPSVGVHKLKLGNFDPNRAKVNTSALALISYVHPRFIRLSPLLRCILYGRERVYVYL